MQSVRERIADMFWGLTALVLIWFAETFLGGMND